MLDTAVVLAATIVAILAGSPLPRRGTARRPLLAAGFASPARARSPSRSLPRARRRAAGRARGLGRRSARGPRRRAHRARAVRARREDRRAGRRALDRGRAGRRSPSLAVWGPSARRGDGLSRSITAPDEAPRSTSALTLPSSRCSRSSPSSASASATGATGEDLDSWLALARDADAVRRAPLRPDAALSSRTSSRRATSCACSPTACCSSASGARSASPSSAARSPRSARGSRARSTTGSRSTCSRSPRTPACSSRARRWSRRCRS